MDASREQVGKKKKKPFSPEPSAPGLIITVKINLPRRGPRPPVYTHFNLF